MVNTCTSTAGSDSDSAFAFAFPFAFEPYIVRSFYRPSRANSNRFGALTNPEPLGTYNNNNHNHRAAAAIMPANRVSRHKRKTEPKWHAKHLDKTSEAVALAHSDVPLPSDRRTKVDQAAGGDEPESYEPHLGVMLPGDITLDSIPRPSPPFVVTFRKARTRAAKASADDWDPGFDWDMVSNASEESFYMV